MNINHLENKLATLADLERAIVEIKASANSAQVSAEDIYLDNQISLWFRESKLTDQSSVFNISVENDPC